MLTPKTNKNLYWIFNRKSISLVYSSTPDYSVQCLKYVAFLGRTDTDTELLKIKEKGSKHYKTFMFNIKRHSYMAGGGEMGNMHPLVTSPFPL